MKENACKIKYKISPEISGLSSLENDQHNPNHFKVFKKPKVFGSKKYNWTKEP